MEHSQEVGLTGRQRYWLKHIRACEASGKSIASYAAEQGFAVKAMYAGKKMLVNKGVLPRTQSKRFHRVQIPRVAVSSHCRVCLPNGLSVDITGTVDAETLAVILNTAAAVT